MEKPQEKQLPARPKSVDPKQAPPTATSPEVAGAKVSNRQTRTAQELKAKKQENLEETGLVNSGGKPSILKPGVLTKAAILAVVNLIAAAAVIFVLGLVQQKAEEVKRLNSIKLGVSGGEAFAGLKIETDQAKAKTDELAEYFPDSQGLVAFVGEIDKLKAEGVVVGFSFVNNEPVKDKTGALGLPVTFELRGNWGQISDALQRIMSLPFILRTILIDAEPSADDPNIIQLRLGAILYVDKTFIQN